MQTQLRISETTEELLRCPVCYQLVRHDGQHFTCTNSECGSLFPIVDGIPVLLDERKSVFSIEDYIAHKETFFNDADGSKNRLRKLAVRLVPSINRNVRSRENYRQLGNLLLRQCSTPRVLVIGGSILGQGMEALTRYGSLDLVETDVSLGPRTALVCDAHDLPFKDESFDCVIAQAVLEHVVDPYACVEEAHRVLKPGGLIYAETPFIQQVHGGRFDFTRFTYLGHRRLFRNFEEISSGATCGPGMALAWSYQYFLLSFTTSRRLRGLIRVFAALTSFYLKYFDAFLINKPAALDAASSYFFVGRRVDEALPDRDLIQLYKR